MESKNTTYPLRLPRSLKAEVEKLSEEDGVSMNQFVLTAVAEKVATMRTAAFFAERGNKANRAVFRQILNRQGGEKPRPEDTL